MAAVTDTAYPRLASAIAHSELQRRFRVTRKERTWLSSHRFSVTAQLDCAVFLKCFQTLGYFPPPSRIPVSVVKYICAELQHKPLSQIAPSQRTSHRIKQAVRDLCGVKLFSAKANERWLYDFACQMAETKESPIDIINAMIEILIKESFELPGFSTLNRYANRARAATLNRLFTTISDHLSTHAKATLDDLLVTRTDDGFTEWHSLKQEPRKPTSKTVAEYIRHAQWITDIRNAIGVLPDIPEQKRYQCVLEARAYSADRIKRLRAHKRYSLMAILEHEQRLFVNDALVDMLIRDIRKLHNAARKALQDFQPRAATESASLVTLLRDVAGICATEVVHDGGIDQIMTLFDHDPQQIIDRCDKLVPCCMTSITISPFCRIATHDRCVRIYSTYSIPFVSNRSHRRTRW